MFLELDRYFDASQSAPKAAELAPEWGPAHLGGPRPHSPASAPTPSYKTPSQKNVFYKGALRRERSAPSEVFLELDRYFDASQSASKAAELAPEWGPAHLTAARAHLEFGEVAAAACSQIFIGPVAFLHPSYSMQNITDVFHICGQIV